MNAFQAKLANVRFLVVGGRCARNLKIVFLQTTLKGNVPMCTCNEVSCLVSTISTIVSFFELPKATMGACQNFCGSRNREKYLRLNTVLKCKCIDNELFHRAKLRVSVFFKFN